MKKSFSSDSSSRRFSSGTPSRRFASAKPFRSRENRDADEEMLPRRRFDRPENSRSRGFNSGRSYERDRRVSEARPARAPGEISPVDVARAFNVASTVWHLFADVMEKGQPLDKTLTAFFREHKKYGSTDRRFISETIYSLCRWWGVCKDFAPDPDAPQIWRCLSRSILENDGLWFHPLWFAWQMDKLSDFIVSPIGKIWTRHVGTALAREGKTLDPEKTEHEFNAKLFPAWFRSVLPKNVPFEKICEVYQKRPPLWLRFQHDVTETLEALAKEEIVPSPSAALPMAFGLENTRVNLFNSYAFRKGWIEVQDISSQCIGIVCAPPPKTRWLDYCAGAGGKTLQLASLLENKGTVVAVDKRNWKLDDLRKRARRAQLCNIQTKETTGDFPKVGKNLFDGVLVDAPCSCTGTWRRNPDARWTTQPSEIEELATLQREILNHACKSVKPGGVLVYATCSITNAENEENVTAFLAAHPEFSAEAFQHPLIGAECATGMCRILPWEGDGDAMFVARLRRNAEA